MRTRTITLNLTLGQDRGRIKKPVRFPLHEQPTFKTTVSSFDAVFNDFFNVFGISSDGGLSYTAGSTVSLE